MTPLYNYSAQVSYNQGETTISISKTDQTGHAETSSETIYKRLISRELYEEIREFTSSTFGKTTESEPIELKNPSYSE